MAIRNFLKKVSYALGSNIVNTFLSVLTTLVVPAFLGNDVIQYGYFQIYLFYVGYVGFFHFGWCDGVFLRDGGKRYEDLDKKLYSSQFWLLSLFELFICIIIITVSYLLDLNSDYYFISWMFAGNVLVYVPRTMLAYYLQTTNRIKEYASITFVGRSVYALSLIMVFLSGIRNYKLFIVGDLMGKVLALLVAIWWCRDIVFCLPAKFSISIKEAYINIRTGIKLLFANIASLLITGIVRWGIQYKWDVATYGKISFTLSVSSLLLIFISAISLVLYPTLRNVEEKKLISLYQTLHNALMFLLLGCLVLYYPIQSILSSWLPQYSESMKYMAILFPMCIYSAKMTMLIQTYMNVFRMEKKVLLVNLAGVVVALISTVISVFVLENLTVAMLSIVFNQMFRCIFAEYLLSKEISINVKTDIMWEAFLTIVFIIVSWFIGGWLGVLLYAVFYLLYLLLNRENLFGLYKYFKSSIKR